MRSRDAAAGRGACHVPCTRIGTHDGKVYLDLGTDDWSAIEVDTGGWRMVSRPPVKLIRAPGMQALPMPVAGVGGIERLTKLLKGKRTCRVMTMRGPRAPRMAAAKNAGA